jgi:hypothetical protein
MLSSQTSTSPHSDDECNFESGARSGWIETCAVTYLVTHPFPHGHYFQWMCGFPIPPKQKIDNLLES